MRKEFKKNLFRFVTLKSWRLKRRKKFFERIFEDLTKKTEGLERGIFTSIEDDGLSYERSCRSMARSYDYNPIFDEEYGEMNIGKHFDKYQLQKFNSLYAVIRRLSSPWKIILGSGTFKVTISGRENGVPFRFSYRKKVKI